MATKTIADLDLSGKTVLMRVDFNVPLDDSQNVTDDRRIVAALPSIKKVLDADGKLVLMSHLGRPKGEVKPEFSLKPAAEKLGEHLGLEVKLGPADAIAGDEAKQMVADLQAGEVLCLENVRFDSREDTKEDISQVEALGQEMGDLGADVYVNDAFGTCHRKHASMWGCPKAMKAAGKPAVAGLLVEKEIKYLHEAVSQPKTPFVAILGGAKVSDKIKLIDSLLGKCDKILIGGAMAYTLLKAQGHTIGTSLCEEDQVETMKALLGRADGKIVLPVDHVCAADFKSDDAQAIESVDIPEGLMGMDIGTQTINLYEEVIKSAGTVVWNGPMGVFEREAYADGTKAVAEAIANATAGGTVSVIGGGDSAAAVEKFGLAEKMTHVSTGGGASLTYLEGKPMPPIEILDEK
jgi:phosphoglycerate kinase